MGFWTIIEKHELIETFSDEALTSLAALDLVHLIDPGLKSKLWNLRSSKVKNWPTRVDSCLHNAWEFHSHPCGQHASIRTTKSDDW